MPGIGTCSVCKRGGLTLTISRQSGLEWCGRCAKNSRLEKCAHCGEVKPVRGRTENGEPRCRRCMYRLQPKEGCFHCDDGIPKRVACRREGKPLCAACCRALKAEEPCDECGKLIKGEKRVDGKPICYRCAWQKSSFLCGDCEREKNGYPAGRRQDGKAICPACFKAKRSFLCAFCEQKSRGYPQVRTRNGMAMCQSCVRARVSFKCGFCEQEKLGYPRAVEEDIAVCQNCFFKHINRRGKCDFCPSTGLIQSVVKGKNKCRACSRRNKPKVDCVMCGNCRWVQAYFDGKPVCIQCYRHNLAPREPCAACGKVRSVVKRIGKARLALCRTCYRKEEVKLRGKCSGCNKEGPIEFYTADGGVFCRSCSREQPGEYEQCSVCRLNRIVHARDAHKQAVCWGCYLAVLAVDR